MFVCPSAGCNTTRKYKCNIKKGLKSCYALNKQRGSIANNKICPDCGKEFLIKSNRDRHFKQFHSEKVVQPDDEEDEELPTMVVIPNEAVLTIDHVEPANDMPQSSSDVLDALFYFVDTNDVVDTNVGNTTDVVRPSQESLNSTAKRSRLESVFSKITCHIDHSFTLNQCVIKKLKLDLKNSKTAAARYMQNSFGEMLDDEGFLNWLSLAIGYKPIV